MGILGLLFIHFDIKDIYEEVKKVFPEDKGDAIKEKLKEMFIDAEAELRDYIADRSCAYYSVGFYSDFAEDCPNFCDNELTKMYKTVDKIFYESGVRKGTGIYIDFVNFS